MSLQGHECIWPRKLLKTEVKNNAILEYTKLIDLWALGVFLHEMILMVPPYDVMYIAYRRFKKVCLREEKERKWKPGNISEEAKDLIQRLLRVDPKSRLGAMGFH